MPSLAALIEEVEHASPSPEPLALLETASASARNLDDLTDSMLSHFVDKCRRSGHSWAEIGGALGVSKQAVQKRFTSEMIDPEGWDRFTERARRLVTDHAPAAAESLGHNWVGTEHLLLGLLRGSRGPRAPSPRGLRARPRQGRRRHQRPHRTRRIVRQRGDRSRPRVGGARVEPTRSGRRSGTTTSAPSTSCWRCSASAASAPRSSRTRTSPTTAHGQGRVLIGS